jgi:hypothetical protein
MVGVNVAAADLCISPEANIKSVLTGADAAFADLYMYCKGPQEEALRLVAQASAEFTSVC